MAGVLAHLALAAVLAGAALLKLASPRSSAAALGTFGLPDSALRWLAWGGLICAELGLAAGVAAGSDAASYLAAGMLALFGLALLGALLRGRAGAPCACFGSRSRVGWPAVARNFALAAAFAGLPMLPTDSLSTDEWLALGLVVALLACAGLGVAVLALAREVGMLRLRLGPQSALEIPEEGPPLGERAAMAGGFEVGPGTELLLAVFLSEGCHVCRTVEPALESLAREPVLSVRVLEEAGDAAAWRELRVPGSPYAIALDLDGTVLAKGSFNTLAQLESVLATAERRRSTGALEVRAGA
jgi:Methylamine utilisation protein MauE